MRINRYPHIYFWVVLLSVACAKLSAVGRECAFVSSYEQWIDPNHRFVEFLEEDQARVIFNGSSVYSADGEGERPTVSEGMGYGLLLAYANDDQTRFDQFLRYVINIANRYGSNAQAQAPFMMPWIVNEKGKPFWFKSSPKAQAFYSSGSATDADIQIAWAISLAERKMQKGEWKRSLFKTTQGNWDYRQIFEEMALEIHRMDIDLIHLRYLPGNQWGKRGEELIHPGYLTPAAFVALDRGAPIPISHSIIHNSLKILKAFQSKYHTRLIPNIIYLDETDYSLRSRSFSYDASRFPLWASHFLQSTMHQELYLILQKLVDAIPHYVQEGTIPPDGIDAIQQVPIGSWDEAPPALNAPLLCAADLLNNQPLFDMLKSSVCNYDITKKQPSLLDPIGHTDTYFNAAILLLSRAILEQKLQ